MHQEATDGNPNNGWHLCKPKQAQNRRLPPWKVWAPAVRGWSSGDGQTLPSTQRAPTTYGCSVQTTPKLATGTAQSLAPRQSEGTAARQQRGTREAPWEIWKSCTGSPRHSGRDRAEPFGPPLAPLWKGYTGFSLLNWRRENNVGICREHPESWGGISRADGGC